MLDDMLNPEVEEEEVEEIAVEESGGEEDASDEGEDVAGEESKDEPKPKAKTKVEGIPLDKYMKEKKRRQEVERILAQQASEREQLRLTQELMTRGWSEAEARLQAEEKVKQQQRLAALESKLVDSDIRDLAKNDDFFSDAELYRDEIKEKMQSHNLGAEEAYMLIRGKDRAREIKVEQEQRAIAKRRQVETKKVENAGSTVVKNTYKLTDIERKALAGLKQAQPDAGWDEKKYWELMKNT